MYSLCRDKCFPGQGGNESKRDQIVQNSRERRNILRILVEDASQICEYEKGNNYSIVNDKFCSMLPLKMLSFLLLFAIFNLTWLFFSRPPADCSALEN